MIILKLLQILFSPIREVRLAEKHVQGVIFYVSYILTILFLGFALCCAFQSCVHVSFETVTGALFLICVVVKSGRSLTAIKHLQLPSLHPHLIHMTQENPQSVGPEA